MAYVNMWGAGEADNGIPADIDKQCERVTTIRIRFATLTHQHPPRGCQWYINARVKVYYSR